ncbi:MAG TPA: GDSL-type esterase/lipase family protein [Sphingobacterium sp.]|nr:GDSL-type esterase/lipase family protein [Sphingobacterium sp.]
MRRNIFTYLKEVLIDFCNRNRKGITFLLFLFLIFGAVNNNYAQAWLPTVEKYLAESKENPPAPESTFFMGSSTWTQWGKTLEEDFVDYQAVNRGFGGSRIPDLLAYMDPLMMPYKPTRVLFFCGTNDLLRNSPDSVFRDFKTFLGRLWAVYPETQVYFVSVPHAPSRKKHWDKGDSLNEKVKELAEEDEGLIYIDIVKDMYNEEDVVNEDFYKSDRLHMNRSGQEIWIPKIKKALDENPIVKRSKKTQKRLYKHRKKEGIFQKNSSE